MASQGSWQPGQSFLPFSPGAPRSFEPGTIRFVPKAQWVPDSKAKLCFLCPKVKFGMKHRRHHCRMCGQVCCGDCSGRRHPKYPDTRICTPCYSMIMVGENKLQAAGWYHGALKRPTGEKRLMSPGTRYGDFMVRESGSVDGYIALSVRTDNKVLHYLIHEKFGRFFIGNEPKPDQMFASIQNLITENKAKYNLLRAMIIESFDGDTCPQCGATVNGDMEFCEECGTRLRSTQAQIQLYEDQGEQAVTYDDDGAGAHIQIYDDDEQQARGEQIYDDDDAPQLPFAPQGSMQNSAAIMMGGAPAAHQWQPAEQQQQWQQPQASVPQQLSPQVPAAQQWQQAQGPAAAPQVQPWQPPAEPQQWQQPQQQPQQQPSSFLAAGPAAGHKFCHNCGSKESMDAVFCGSCGTGMH